MKTVTTVKRLLCLRKNVWEVDVSDWKSERLMKRLRVGELVKEEIFTQYSSFSRFHTATFSIRTEIKKDDPQHLTLLDMFEGATSEDFADLGREILDKYIDSKTRNL